MLIERKSKNRINKGYTVYIYEYFYMYIKILRRENYLVDKLKKSEYEEVKIFINRNR